MSALTLLKIRFGYFDRSADELIVSHFFVEVGGLLVAAFKQCSGLGGEIEVDTYQEGGLNGYEHRLPKGARYGTVTLGAGVGSGPDLWQWFYDVSTGKVQRRNVSIVMYAQTRAEAVRWNLAGAYPVRWQGPQFTAGEDSVAIQSLELAHNGITMD
jgi:phage tail-like protein